MLRRLFLTLLASFLLLAVAGLCGWPLVLLRPHLDTPTALMALCLWVALVSVMLLAAANTLLQRIWFFRGSGEAISLDQLRQRLLTVNALDCPVTATLRGKKVILTWRYREIRWCELFSRLGLNRLYELQCRFDADTRTVYLVDRLRVADFLICPDRVKIGRPRIPLPLLRTRCKGLAAIEGYATMAEHDYDLHPREIKTPILGTILSSGWHVRFSLF